MLLESTTRHAPHNVVEQPRRELSTSRAWGTPNKPAVADLTVAEIDAMTRNELIGVLSAAGLPVQREADVAMWAQICDQRALRRLAHVARRGCRMRGY